ncbi:MAG: hypothetical protein R3B40_08305 [Polyangiales bacterium]
MCTVLGGCAHQRGAVGSPEARPGVAVVLLAVDPEHEEYAVAVARALRRGPSPSGAPWLPVPAREARALGDELQRIEALFFDLDLPGAERAARDTLAGMDDGLVVVTDQPMLLQVLIRAAQVFDAQGSGDAADDALRRAEAVRPGFELSAVDFPPSLIARRAALGTTSERRVLTLRDLPAGATVHVDGAPLHGAQVELARGSHVVRIGAPGYLPEQRRTELDDDAVLVPELAVDPERLHALPADRARAYLASHDAHTLRLQLAVSNEGRSCRLAVDGEPSVSVLAPLDEGPPAVAARLLTEREAAQDARLAAATRRRRVRGIVTATAVAAAGAGAGAYVGLRPGADGWRGSGQLAESAP